MIAKEIRTPSKTDKTEAEDVERVRRRPTGAVLEVHKRETYEEDISESIGDSSLDVRTKVVVHTKFALLG